MTDESTSATPSADTPAPGDVAAAELAPRPADAAGDVNSKTVSYPASFTALVARGASSPAGTSIRKRKPRSWRAVHRVSVIRARRLALQRCRSLGWLEWLDDSVSRLYDQETRVLNLMAGASMIGIGVACLGLFAVAALVTESRRKEVALRKVFGASSLQIVNLLSWNFLKVVVLANLLAWPVAWAYMNNWLNGFVYRVDLSMLQFLIPGIISFVIAWMTVAGQALMVARSHPIHSLRHE